MNALSRTLCCVHRKQFVSGQTQKFVCTLSTLFSDATHQVTVHGYTPDDTPEQQSQPSQLQIARTEARAKYMAFMDLVDETNKDILLGLARFKKFHWTTAHLVWLVTVAVIINARRIFQSASGTGAISVDDWIDQAVDALTHSDEPFAVAHAVLKVPDHRRRNCRSCQKFDHIERQTRKYCKLCGPICKYCAKNNKHKNFADMNVKFWL